MTSYGATEEQALVHQSTSKETYESFPRTSSEVKEQLKSGWRKYVAELLGTLLFVYLLTLSSTNQLLQISETKGFIGTGLSLFAAISVFGRQSGGHYNPAVSLGALIAGHLSVLDAVLYVLMQIVGAFLGALLVEASVSNTANYTIPSTNISWFQGIIIELILTTLLVSVVLLASETIPNHGAKAALVGATLATATFAGATTTGSSLNPARSLGPALVGVMWSTSSNVWLMHYIYWIGPLLGGCLAAVIHKTLLTAEENRWGNKH